MTYRPRSRRKFIAHWTQAPEYACAVIGAGEGRGSLRGDRGMGVGRAWLGRAIGCVVAGLIICPSAWAATGGAGKERAISARVSVRSIPGPPAGVFGLACADATQCYAVGYAQHRGAVVPIQLGVPGRPEEVSDVNTLENVACGSAVTCEAVGENSKQQAVVVGLASGTPGPAQTLGPQYDVLGGVACENSPVCEAVGADQGLLVQAANGAPTAVQFVPNVGFFFGISCVSSTCEALGESVGSETGVLVQINNGVPGNAQRDPASVELDGVACPSAGRCVAVGGFAPSHAHIGVVASIDDGVLGPIHRVPAAAFFSSVACPTSTTCEALGNTREGPHTPARGLLETITNGTPRKKRSLSHLFSALACPSQTRCYAVGNSDSKPSRGYVGVIRVR